MRSEASYLLWWLRSSSHLTLWGTVGCKAARSPRPCEATYYRVWLPPNSMWVKMTFIFSSYDYFWLLHTAVWYRNLGNGHGSTSGCFLEKSVPVLTHNLLTHKPQLQAQMYPSSWCSQPKDHPTPCFFCVGSTNLLWDSLRSYTLSLPPWGFPSKKGCGEVAQ